MRTERGGSDAGTRIDNPDRADAVVMSWYRGVTGDQRRQMWPGTAPREIQVIRSHEKKRNFLRR